MKYLFVIVFSVFLLNSYAQNTESFSILDSVSKQPIPFVKVIVEDKGKGTYSNEKGIVKLEGLSNNEVLLINHVGYNKMSIQVRNIENQKPILLSQKTYKMDEVIITASKYNEKYVGYAKEKSNGTWGTAIEGTELCVLVKPKKTNSAFIREIILRTKNHSNNNPLIRVHLYKNDKGKPGEQIILKDNVRRVKDKKLIKFDIEKQHIKLPESGLFVSAEWVGTYDKNRKRIQEDLYGYSLKFKSRRRSIRNYPPAFSRDWDVWNKAPSGLYPLFGLKIIERKE